MEVEVMILPFCEIPVEPCGDPLEPNRLRCTAPNVRWAATGLLSLPAAILAYLTGGSHELYGQHLGMYMLTVALAGGAVAVRLRKPWPAMALNLAGIYSILFGINVVAESLGLIHNEVPRSVATRAICAACIGFGAILVPTGIAMFRASARCINARKPPPKTHWLLNTVAVICVAASLLYTAHIQYDAGLSTMPERWAKTVLQRATPDGASPLRKVWTYRGRAAFKAGDRGIACGDFDGKGKQQVLVGEHVGDSKYRVAVLNDAGNAIHTLALRQYPRALELAHFDGRAVVLAFGGSDGDLVAYYAEGRTLRTFTWRSGLCSAACPIDVGAPGGDAIIVGGGASGGVWLVNPDDTVRWKHPDAGSVWSVAGTRVGPHTPNPIVCASTEGEVTAYDISGKYLFALRPQTRFGEAYMDGVLAADLDGDGADEILAMGITHGAIDRRILWVYDMRGVERWHYEVGSFEGPFWYRATVGSFAPPGRQVAVTAPDGTVAVLDAHGKLMGKRAIGAEIDAIRTLPGVAGKPDRIIVGTEYGCMCFEWRGGR
jgi:hypothetical protein